MSCTLSFFQSPLQAISGFYFWYHHTSQTCIDITLRKGPKGIRRFPPDYAKFPLNTLMTLLKEGANGCKMTQLLSTKMVKTTLMKVIIDLNRRKDTFRD